MVTKNTRTPRSVYIGLSLGLVSIVFVLLSYVYAALSLVGLALSFVGIVVSIWAISSGSKKIAWISLLLCILPLLIWLTLTWHLAANVYRN